MHLSTRLIATLVLPPLTCLFALAVPGPAPARAAPTRGAPTQAAPPGEVSTRAAPDGSAVSPGTRLGRATGPGAATAGRAATALPAPAAVTWAAPNRYGWPLGPPHPVVRPFQPPSTPYGPGHRGVDLGSVAGAEVLAAGDGVVAFAGRIADRELVSVQHADGIRTTYEPLAPLVTTGDVVRRGQPIGVVRAGHPECAAAACLHWGAKRGETYLDPLRLLAHGAVRLLPWRDG